MSDDLQRAYEDWARDLGRERRDGANTNMRWWCPHPGGWVRSARDCITAEDVLEAIWELMRNSWRPCGGVVQWWWLRAGVLTPVADNPQDAVALARLAAKEQG